MIKITIQRVAIEEYQESQNFLVKETPTEITQESSSTYQGTKKEVQYLKEYAVQEVTKRQSVTYDLLTQQIADDSKFDLAAVIKAVNGMK